MAKKVKPVKLKNVAEVPDLYTVPTTSPEETLGQVLFARRKAEEIVQLLNNVSDYVIGNNVGLDRNIEEVNVTLNNLKLLVNDLAYKTDRLG